MDQLGLGVTSTYTVKQLTWPEVWSTMRLSYVAWQFYARAWVPAAPAAPTLLRLCDDAFRSQTSTSAMDSQLQQICALAKGPMA